MTAVTVLLFGLAATATVAADDRPPAVLPEGVEQIIPRGAIPAIFDPIFISAEEAEIPPGAWVLGVVLDGQARAYSLNLLNRHEIVNDRVGEKSFAAVW